VLGKNPAATFLSNILHSPIVAHRPQPGTYFVDDTIAPRLRHELAEHHAELRDLPTGHRRGRRRRADRSARARTLRSATVRRLERDVAESDAAFTTVAPAPIHRGQWLPASAQPRKPRRHAQPVDPIASWPTASTRVARAYTGSSQDKAEKSIRTLSAL
jgi:hypothetical protein